MSKEVFFMVYLENERTPTYKHTNLESAETEATTMTSSLLSSDAIAPSLYISIS